MVYNLHQIYVMDLFNPPLGSKMKIRLLSILLFLMMPCHSALAASTLLSVSRTHTRESTQIYFSFDTLPVHSIDIREKRLDISLDKTRLAKGLQFFPADTRIIKILPITNNDRTVISLFFRHKPEKIKTERNKDGKLIIEILVGSQPDPTDQLINKQLKDLTALNGKPEVSTNPLKNSAYAGNWHRFFSDYESELSYSVPVHFTIPPFPLIDLLPALGENTSQLLPTELNELAAKGLWSEMQPILLDLLKGTKDLEQQKKITLTLAEVLLQSGNFADADKHLSLLVKEYKEEPVGTFARFLLTLLKAKSLDNYSASPEFGEMEKSLGLTSRFLPHLVMFEIESALAAKQFKKAQQLLDRQDVAYPTATQKIKDLRQADTYVGLQQPLKAYVAYQLLKDTTIINTYPDSLKGYCDTLYFHKKYNEAGECYTRLIPMVNVKEASGLISFRKAMSEMRLNETAPPVDSFSLVEDAFPGTEAGYRAALKTIDLKYLTDETWSEEAPASYHSLAEKAVLRPLVAEALFKEALVFSLLNKKTQALSLLRQFLRDFQTGELRPTALALLIDILPGEIQKLVEERKFPEALILAKENREVFQKNWLDIKILADLAYSYRQIGLYNHAREMYLYVMNIVKIDQREQYYLPLLQTVSDQGDRNMVEQLASRYFNTYSQGKSRDEILIIRLNALIVEGQLTKAQSLLPSPVPKNPPLQIIAATLAFLTDKYADALVSLNELSQETRHSTPELLFMYGESLFQTGDMAGSEKAFNALQDKKYHSEQVYYRLSQIELGRGNTENALKFLQKIVNTGEDSLWKRYAAKDLEYVQSAERLRRKLE